MTGTRVVIHADRTELVAAVAERFVTTLTGILRDDSREVHIALTGGTAGIAVLAETAARAERDDVDWSRVHLWWGDERWVAHDDAERNERQARDALIDRIAIPEHNVHPFPAADGGLGLDEAADAYSAQLAGYADDGLGFPRFAITFLGVGPDGHVASLFPDRAEVTISDRSVVPVRDSPKPPPERLSLTLPAITASERVWLVLSGSDKTAALGLALAGASYVEVPAAGAEGRDETIFFVDAEAAERVPRELFERDE